MVAIDDTLHLHAVADDIDWNFNEPRLAGVRMPIDKWPTSTTPTGHAVLAVWALKPWGALSTPPMPIEIRDPLGVFAEHRPSRSGLKLRTTSPGWAQSATETMRCKTKQLGPSAELDTHHKHEPPCSRMSRVLA